MLIIDNVPFMAINLHAFGASLLMFLVFLAAKKTPEIKAFLFLLFDCVLWTAGSTFMRLQLWPGFSFWYYVSLVAIFSMEMVFYIFLHCFTHSRHKFTLWVLGILTIALIPGTVSGFFLAPPRAVERPSGGIGYVYATDWRVVFPFIVIFLIVAASLRLLVEFKRQQGVHASGVRLLFVGGLVILLGNLMQILIPGNMFPFDTLSGVFFVCFVAFALYRRRLFRMTLIISRGLLLVVVAVLCLAMSAYFVNPLTDFFIHKIGLPEDSANGSVAMLLALILVAGYTSLKKLIDALFVRDQVQNRIITRFSSEVTQTLSTDDIMQKLADAILSELPARQLYICLADGPRYRARYSSNPLAMSNFTIEGDSPKVAYLRDQDTYLTLNDFAAASPRALSDWAEEKELLRRLEIDSLAAMRVDGQVVGVVLLSARDHDRAFSVSEISFLETLCAIASIALKNAELYEKIYREARIDPLTSAFNYRAFVDSLEDSFRACKRSSLALIYVDVDDFKLYNQLYGVEQGDQALRRICQEITLAVGTAGSVYRTSGKVFAVLLPGQDSQQAYTLAGVIRQRIARINESPELRRFKNLTASAGICAAPYAASSAKELMDNADQACYNAKQSGKDQIALFRCTEGPIPQHLEERTESIVEGSELSGGNYRSALAMISALTAAIDAKDHYTYDHSKNVATYAANLAVAAGLNDDQVRTIYAAGLLHDVGKISIPENVLNKTGRLTTGEYLLMQAHVNNSIEMIRHLPEMDYVVPAVLGHHERWDGKGYPRGIRSDEIPITARCLSIADVFDAMTTNRPYRGGMSLEYVLDFIQENAGVQFDPRLAALFVELVRQNDIPLPERERMEHQSAPERDPGPAAEKESAAG